MALVAVAAYLTPLLGSTDHAKTSGPTSPSVPATAPQQSPTDSAPSTPGPDPAAAPSAAYLAAISPQAGGSNLTDLPRELRDTSEFDQAVKIECPSNQSNDKMRDVIYELRGRYDSFEATVRPFFANQSDAVMYVDVFAAERARDGSLIWTKRGGQYTATAAQPAPLTAVVDGAEQMKIQVRCELPDGMAILVDAALRE
ncbi:hypothetical protein ACN27F_04610 [Solwaraspora sp. WMMB335]|uniref:hypothetical protein n=1 Tax=Solwaraspora sp. WMMB335 TaxID=3404118 RepID=UPI003B96608D